VPETPRKRAGDVACFERFLRGFAGSDLVHDRVEDLWQQALRTCFNAHAARKSGELGHRTRATASTGRRSASLGINVSAHTSPTGPSAGIQSTLSLPLKLGAKQRKQWIDAGRVDRSAWRIARRVHSLITFAARARKARSSIRPGNERVAYAYGSRSWSHEVWPHGIARVAGDSIAGREEN
jgi:hypothetical protein